ncbi:MAG: SDR family oxidoreductase, partial [Anaerolineae bacterium]|nr:SDR family oxidoreductase [Anaerolineae bacterium]
VNGVVPGPMLPPPGLPQAVKDRLAAETLLGRWGKLQDVVDAVLYLIRADYVTGEVLFVDGGDRWGHYHYHHPHPIPPPDGEREQEGGRE